MKKVSIFLDSSALIAGVISENGAAHVLLQLGETESVSLTISKFVFNETTRSIGRKSPENLANVQKEIEKAKGYKDDISKIVYDFLEKNGESLDSMEEVPSDIGPSINNHPATLGPGKGRREIFTSPVIGTISENAPISHRETFQTEIDPASQTEQISVAKAETSAQEEKNSSEIQSIQEVLQNPQPDSENYDKISTLIPETEPIPQPDSDLNVVDLRTGHENLQQIADPIDKLTEEADEKEADFITKVEDTHAVAN